MEQRTLGKDLKVSAIGFGCMGLSHAYGAPLDEGEAVKLIRRAFDCGYTFFDTAEVYGTQEDPHANERLVGEALAPVRGEAVIATKFGLAFDKESGKTPYPLIPDSRPETIRRAVEGSLARLRTDHIDLMMARWHEALFPAFEELGVGFVAFSPMANGLLTGKYVKGSRFDARYDYRAAMPQFADEAAEKNAALLSLLRRYAEEKRATPAQISLAWMLRKKPWIVPIPGTRSETRMEENAGAAAVALSPEEARAIDAALDGMEMSEVFGGSKISEKKD